MQLSDLRHQSDSRYCFSVGPGKVRLRLAVSRAVHLNAVTLVHGDPMYFYKRQNKVPMELRYTDMGFNYYEGLMEGVPERFMYVFYLQEDGGACYYSESGLTPDFHFDLAFISAFQFVGENPLDYVIDKPSWQGRVFYQIFPERFACRGDPKAKPYVDTPWNCKTLRGKRNPMLGGDLYGASDQLEYLRSIGVGAVYLTPIHPSPSNHKYDVVDYFDVDPNFGGPEAFHHFVEKAHGLGMKVMMDLVFNHSAYGHPFFQDVKQKGRASPYHDWYWIDGDCPIDNPLNFRCFGYFRHMPKWNTNNKDVQRYLISIAEYWMKDYGVDGFRLDVSEGVSHDFWTRMKLALKENDPEVLIIGENWLNSESYLGPNQFDGVMNYPFLGVASGYVLGLNDAVNTAERLTGLLMRYKDGHNAMMMNILSSHDVQRFRTLAKDSIDLSLIGYAMLVFFPGYPLIYYGEEIFMKGGGDPDNRQGMEWESPHFHSLEGKTFAELLRLRQKDALKKGRASFGAKDGLLWMRREYEGEAYVLYLNVTTEGIAIEGEPILCNHYAGNTVWSRGFAVVKRG